jgi:hypothetical protein
MQVGCCLTLFPKEVPAFRLIASVYGVKPAPASSGKCPAVASLLPAGRFTPKTPMFASGVESIVLLTTGFAHANLTTKEEN